jgi:hypothetical protein
MAKLSVTLFTPERPTGAMKDISLEELNRHVFNRADAGTAFLRVLVADADESQRRRMVPSHRFVGGCSSPARRRPAGFHPYQDEPAYPESDSATYVGYLKLVESRR